MRAIGKCFVPQLRRPRHAMSWEQALEARLSCSEAAEFRWWAWAEQQRQQGALPAVCRTARTCFMLTLPRASPA